MHRYNWDDLRYVLAVADTGSVASAARVLGVAHTTVLRRVAAFEAESGVRLFDRTARGYAISPDKRQAVEALRAAGAAVAAARAQIDAISLPPGATLRVTSTDTLCATILPAALKELAAAHPGQQTALLAHNTHFDLGHGHADLAVRPARALPDDLTGKVAAQLGFAVYAAPGAPRDWLGSTGALSRSPPGQWMADAAPTSAAVADSFLILREMAVAGAGRTLLPCILGDPDGRIIRISGPAPELRVPVWVAAHAELGDSAWLKRLRRDLTRAVEARKAELLGNLTDPD